MADSIDRVFVHALNTVKKIPKTGATRPPAGDRMRLYGLYKQAMEGDVDGVMERPTAASMAAAAAGTTIGSASIISSVNSNNTASSSISSDEVAREQDKWDAWNSQKGISRTEAKRRYVEALIETMHRYANTPNALELVAELEFVWNQVKSNSPSSSAEGSGVSADSQSHSHSGSGDSGREGPRRFQTPLSGADGPMRVLSPMSEEDESERRLVEEADLGDDDSHGEYAKRNDKRTKRMERAIVRLSAEIAALREQIATGREWRSRKERSVNAWVGWSFWLIAKHFAIDLAVLFFLVLWMRRRKDKRLEDHVRGVVRIAREYIRKVLPAR
ncbi:acyl CoA binding protein-domain-containing protein [Lasiosphaeria hispida]|uniref:Acyl CoA binding protein-domain-containing protein n=1 Tax=Lasiosphaeria hispida TaxID=260671 RepID=A0AAJ0H8W1_9PEZI|nr:acyl CoA binding protein-domain-containing protein [Lasiosphaeria hispida]